MDNEVWIDFSVKISRKRLPSKKYNNVERQREIIRRVAAVIGADPGRLARMAFDTDHVTKVGVVWDD